MTKKITPYKLSLHNDEFMIIIEPTDFDPKSQKILVSLDNKVVEGVYNPSTKNITAKVSSHSNMTYDPVQKTFVANKLRVKVFVKDFFKDEIISSKLQEFIFNEQTLEYQAINELMTTSSFMTKSYDKKITQKDKRIYVGKSISAFGYWTSNKEGTIIITHANLGSQVFFHLISKDIKDGTKLILRLSDNDGLLKPDTMFPTKMRNQNTGKTQYVKRVVDVNVIIKKGKATIPIFLDENWASMISSDVGSEIELQWKAYSDSFEKTIKGILNVGYSKRFLYFKTPFEDYSLPEMLTDVGETVVFALGDFFEIKDKIIKKFENYRFFVGARILSTGKVVTNTGDIYLRKKSIYNYNIHTNNGKKIKIQKASNFGFKNKYIKDGKPQITTTKGISQIDYFSNTGVFPNVSKIATNVLELWDINDLGEILFTDRYGDIPTGLLPTPIGFAFELLNSFVIKPHFENSIQDLKDATAKDFEIIKQKGLVKCKEFVDSDMLGVILMKYSYELISTKTLVLLLKGEFLTKSDMINFNEVNSESTEWIHTVFFSSQEDQYRKSDFVHFIECIFISNTVI